MYQRHTEGQICETILTEYLLRHDMYVYRPQAAFGPADVIAISKDGKIYMFDAKKDALRYVPDRKTSQRIYRVRMAYVNIDTRGVHIVPPIEELTGGNAESGK